MDALHHWIEQFHQMPCRCVLALSGGGSAAASQLLRVPGGSRTIVEVVIPYHQRALDEFLGGPPAQYCEAATSAAMAHRAAERARWLAPGEMVLGVGCTASLVSDRPKRGDHRCHVSTVYREQCRTWSLTLTRGARNREGEEALASALVFHALAWTLRMAPPPPLLLLEEERVEEQPSQSDGVAVFLRGERPLYVDPDGRFNRDRAWDPGRPMALLPGAFNPLHHGHGKLAAVAEEMLGVPVVFELSVANVDKPELSAEEVRRRLAPFGGWAAVWLTHAAKFMQKARLFPGATFVIGADTAVRVVSPRYYDNDPARMLAGLELIANHGCRFLVACRADREGACLQLGDIAVPADYRQLFMAIPEARFRLDISSTELRGLELDQ